MVTLNYDEWVEQYQPITNRYTDNGSYDNTLFEYNELEVDLIKCTDCENIWTLVSGEDEESWIIPGLHIVNRMGYFVTNVPHEYKDIQVNDNEMITVGKAKYSCKEFIENILEIELTDEQEDKLHNFYSQL